MPGGASRYGWFVGVVGVLLISLITLNTFRSEGPGSRGITTGGSAPPFAAPLALSDLEGDVNVATKAGSGDAGAVPACSVRGPDVLNLCALYERGPVVLAFFATRGEDCVTQLDLLDDVAARHPKVAFAAVSIRGDRGDLRPHDPRAALALPGRLRRGRDPGQRLRRGGLPADHLSCARGAGCRDTSLGTVTARALEDRVRRLER
jgi:hypothetical protein